MPAFLAPAIIAGVSLMTSLLGQRAQAKQQQQAMQLQGIQRASENETEAAQNLSHSQQQAFTDLLSTWKGALT
jgi:ABC-type uncharacterized transport system ATPase subunit